MAYELANLESTAPSAPKQESFRDEKVVSMYDDGPARLAQARARLEQARTDVDAPVISDGAGVESPEANQTRPLSPQLAALARKEQKFREEQKKLKAAELALETERKEIAELKALKAKLAAGDYSEVDKFVDYEKFTQAKLGENAQSKEMEQLKSEIAAIKADREKDVDERFKSAVDQRRVAVKSLIATSDEFSSIKELKAEEAVVQHILDTWENDEIELSPEDAAKEVEAALIEKAQKWSALSKLKKAQAPEPVVEKKELPPLKPGMKTLTNNMAATGETRPPSKPLHLMNDQERYIEARRRHEEKIKNGIRE